MFSLSLDAPSAGSARLRLSGHLDEKAAHEVLHVAADVVKCGCSRLVVDLAGLVSFDDAASYALTGCCRLERYLSGGVSVVAGSKAGEALAQNLGIALAPADLDEDPAEPGTMVSCPAC